MEKKNAKKKETSILLDAIKIGALGAVCILLIACVMSAFIVKTEDPAANVRLLGFVCCGAGGFLCALFSLIKRKNDALICSVASGTVLCAIAALGSLFFDNGGKDILFRSMPIIIIFASSVVFGLVFGTARKKNRRRLK